MTKEELKQEAEESLDKRLGTYAYIRKQDCYTNYVDGYIDSAEPREKRIKELIALINAERERQEKCDDVHLRTIADLEKENAELKDDNKVMADNYSKMEQKFYNNLTKAKELLKEFVHHYKAKTIYIENMQDLLEQAEQFLSEVEKC